MGRRPNQLVVEFFERGEKLGDNSNRYRHTCRRCGQCFPKGRVDTLQAHVLRNCPKISPEDREWGLQQLQQKPERPRPDNNPTRDDSDQNHESLTQPEPHYQQQSALDTLAEVSRHHLDYSSNRQLGHPGQDHTEHVLDRASTSEQQFIAQLQEFNTPTHPSQVADPNGRTAGRDPTTEHHFFDPQESAPEKSAAPELSGLAQTASAANRQLEASQVQDYPPEHDPFVDPDLHGMGGPVPAQSLFEAISESEGVPWVPAEQSAGHYGFQYPQKPVHKKVRGRFDDSRRKEVAGIRKSGACIRCRMLKKQCSGETPCRTCRNVETARLWKGTCFRARVVDEFTLWSLNLFSSRMITELSATAHGAEHERLPGRVEARLLAGTDCCMNFAVRALVDCSNAEGPNDESARGGRALMLDGEEAVHDKIGAFTALLAEDFIDQESSVFVKKTMQVALFMAQTVDAAQAAKAGHVQGHSPSRACYNLQERLTHNVIELWILTTLLTKPEDSFELRYQPQKSPTDQPERPSGTAGQDEIQKDVQDICPTSTSFRMIVAQLLTAIEARCSRLSKIVMNELERRLLQRQQANQFATFISSLILLNCVERMTGLYRSYDTSELAKADMARHETTAGAANEEEPSDAVTDSTKSDNGPELSEKSTSWPLDTPPSALWPQGLRFADLLTMLLRIRALPPKTGETPEGTLAVVQDHPLPAGFHGRAPRPEADEETKVAAAWLDPMQLNVDELMRKRYGEVPAMSEGVQAWDMRFIAKVLLPERTA
ncbi:uncharacterized protein LTR77_009631 [Saxophila tyrrhenica]|uniref:Zn(2)-C6 fungal-type domain-containing protein n=1 Tax=Saxophila tyrrhenica TaxID=1690608 RepID=A0AAV9P022_9PEZI|nr:hypothetical protein LTR77_009631 [Saxophila tyrrhenica]